MKNVMLRVWVKMQQWSRKEEGQGMVEYGLIIVLIAVVAIVGLQLVGTNVNTVFSNIATKV